MTTVASLKEKVERINSFLKTKESILRDYNTIGFTETSNLTIGDKLKKQVELRDINAEIASYKSKFEEEESRLQALGGKTRKQTLQEFVLLFFWISYAVFTISVGLYTYRTQGSGATQKMVGILVLLALVLTAILIRYA